MSRNRSVVSADVERKLKTMTKASDEPVGIVFAHELARKVTDVVLNAIRVHPAGAAVVEENVLVAPPPPRLPRPRLETGLRRYAHPCPRRYFGW
jgi:hypothetical protein